MARVHVYLHVRIQGSCRSRTWDLGKARKIKPVEQFWLQGIRKTVIALDFVQPLRGVASLSGTRCGFFFSPPIHPHPFKSQWAFCVPPQCFAAPPLHTCGRIVPQVQVDWVKQAQLILLQCCAESSLNHYTTLAKIHPFSVCPGPALPMQERGKAWLLLPASGYTNSTPYSYDSV